jgi:membrane protease YdiL (CAAX protease family)
MHLPQSIFDPVYRLAGRIGFLCVAVALFLVFAVTGLLALYFLLREYLPREGAMGLIALVAALATLIAAWLGTRRSRPKPAQKLVERGANLEAIVRQTVMRDPVGSAVAALAAGLVIASVPELSRLVQRLIGNRPPSP